MISNNQKRIKELDALILEEKRKGCKACRDCGVWHCAHPEECGAWDKLHRLEVEKKNLQTQVGQFNTNT